MYMKVAATGLTMLAALSSYAAPPDTTSLAFKEQVFLHDMRERFLLDGQALCKLKLPNDTRPFVAYNMPDNAYMTGMYLGALSMKYAVTKDPEVRRQAVESIGALHLLCTVSGKPGLLSRAAVKVGAPFEDDGDWHESADKQYKWRDDVSCDQMTGVVYGFLLAYDLVADDNEKALIRADVKALVDHVVSNNMQIVDIDGQPTQWGHYEADYVFKREPMNALLLLQHLKTAAYMTGDPAYDALYREWAVSNKYAERAIVARNMAPPRRTNHSDDVLLYLAYYPLLQLEKDPELLETYRKSFERSYQGADGFPGFAAQGNPLYAFAQKKFFDDPAGVDAGIEFLRLLPFGMKWQPNTIAQYEKQFGFTYSATPVTPEPVAGKVVPIDRRPMAWSAFVQNPYQTDSNPPQTASEYNGHDYLCGYWLGRYIGVISDAM